MTLSNAKRLLFLVVLAAPLHAYDNIQLKMTLVAPPLTPAFAPTGVVVDRSGRVWVSDAQSNSLFLYSYAGTFLERVGQGGASPGSFLQPHGIATDAEGLIFVADTGNHRVQVLSPDGKPRLAFGEKGSGPGQFREPWGIAVSQDGVVVISDRGNQRLQLFSKNGIFLQTIQTGAEIEDVAIDVAGRIYAVNVKSRQIDVWSSAGQLLHSFTGGEPGRKPFTKPAGVAVNAVGLIYVADRGLSQIRELDPAGHTTGLFGRAGSGEGDFRSPEGVAVSGDQFYVADAGNHRISVFSLTRQASLPPLTPVPAVRVQVSLKNLWPVDADSLSINPEGHLLALSKTTGLVHVLDREGKRINHWDAKKLLGMREPAALVNDSSGNIYIADAGANRVFKSDAKGGKLSEFGQKNSMFKGGQGELAKPAALAYGRQNVLVADAGNSRFQVFNDQGLFLFAGGDKGKDPGQLKLPAGIAADNDRIYVADALNHKVVVFNSAGRFLREMGLIGSEALVEPRQISVDAEGNVYVLDAARGRVIVYDDQGVFVAGFGSMGKAKGFFDQPRAMALGEDGRLYVAEQGRIQVFRVVLLPPAPTRLTATAAEGYVELKWEPAKTRFPAKYVIYRGQRSGAVQRIKETVETTMTDGSLTPETTYFYSVAAQSAQGALSVPSAQVEVSARGANNSPRLEIVSAHIDDVFSSQYKFYSRTPLGYVVVRNNGPAPLQKIKVSLSIQGYMDFPTEVELTELNYKDRTEVPLLATFNNRILEVTETTPIQAQVKAVFYQGSIENSIVRNFPFKLYSRNTIRWDKKERFAAFVTPNDPPVIDFARGVALPFAEAHRGAPVPEAIATAWAVFGGLGTYGIAYAPRPTNPYDRVSLDSATVDTMQFPRETLLRKSGDCADVVALLASALESLTIHTVAVDAPGHLFLMFDTGESRKEALAFPDSELVLYAGTYWVPLEVTMLGSPFLDAWKKGAEQYRRWTEQGKISVLDIHQAWKTYEPVTLPEVSLGITPPSRQAIEQKFSKDWQALVNLRWQTAQAMAKAVTEAQPNAGGPWMDLGFLAVEYKRYDDAIAYFTKAKSERALTGAVLNNLANIAYLQNDFVKAELYYRQAQQADPADGGIHLNLARLYMKQGQLPQATAAFKEAIALDPALKDRYSDVTALAP